MNKKCIKKRKVTFNDHHVNEFKVDLLQPKGNSLKSPKMQQNVLFEVELCVKKTAVYLTRVHECRF